MQEQITGWLLPGTIFGVFGWCLVRGLAGPKSDPGPDGSIATDAGTDHPDVF